MDPSYSESPSIGEKKTEALPEGVLLRVAYLGTSFSGWAPQPGQSTVAGTLLDAVRAMRPEVTEVRGSSRTDAGVHARGQVVAFDCDRRIPSKGWVLGLGTHLPDSISVRSAGRIRAGFIPRFHATGKRYEYTLLEDVRRDP
ncbi:MAG: tRNA pseudouridine synthase A, partial [Polyangiaceae bacterium]